MVVLTRAFPLIAWALMCTGAAGASLYDPTLASLPAAQGWSTLSSGNAATQTLVGGRLRTDTQTNPGTSQFVIFRSAPAGSAFDTVGGFTLSFGLQIVSEAHQSDNRAGYSVLVQGVDQAQALELSFWDDEVWSMSYAPGGADSGFVHGNGAALDTSTSFHHYALTVRSNAYTLRVDGSAVLSGNMTDYPVLGLSTLVYGQSNSLFFGDNSSRGQAVTALGAINLSPVPEPAAAMLLVAGLGLLATRRKRC